MAEAVDGPVGEERARQLAWLADLQPELRHLLDAWDPLGVADAEADGEYDCMIAPLLVHLAAGDGRAALSELLWHEVEHLGVDPWGRGSDAFADRLLAWFAAKAGTRPGAPRPSAPPRRTGRRRR